LADGLSLKSLPNSALNRSGARQTANGREAAKPSPSAAFNFAPPISKANQDMRGIPSAVIDRPFASGAPSPALGVDGVAAALHGD
jgi:hypothetical protein